MRLGDLKAVVCSPEGAWQEVPLSESPYYKALATGDRRHFDEYFETLRRFSSAFEDELTWEGFSALAFSIATQGARPRKMKDIRIEDGVIYDGQHRLAALFTLHGADYEV